LGVLDDYLKYARGTRLIKVENHWPTPPLALEEKVETQTQNDPNKTLKKIGHSGLSREGGVV